MYTFYTLDLITSFNRKGRIPLYVEEVPENHPERMFHSHTFTELTLILRGEARHLVGKSSAAIKKGDILVLSPGSTHGYDKVRDFALINLTYDHKKLTMPILDGFEMPLFQRFFPSPGTDFTEEEQSTPVMTLPEDKIEEFAEAIRQLQKELNLFSPGNFYYSLAQFMMIMAKLARTAAAIGNRHWTMSKVGEVIAAIQKEPMLSCKTADLAKRAMMSPRSFFRAFREATGCSPQEFRMQLRMKMALDLLITTDLNLSEIAQKCGFYDSNYFCHLFRKYAKTSPRQFRLKNKTALPKEHSR